MLITVSGARVSDSCCSAMLGDAEDEEFGLDYARAETWGDDVYI
jgi:hypothetical protein